MNFIKKATILLFLVSVYTCFAQENSITILEKNQNAAKDMFFIKLPENDLESCIKIDDNGEMYIKVDRILPVSNEDFFINPVFQASQIAYPSRAQLLSSPISSVHKWIIQCYKCGKIITIDQYNRKCPHCGAVNG